MKNSGTAEFRSNALIHFALICAACFALMIVMTAGVFADETYLDENGDTKSVSSCNSFSQKYGEPGINYNTYDEVAVLSGSENGGWYAVDSNRNGFGSTSYTFTKRMEIKGDVKLILHNGVSIKAELGIHVPYGSSLTVYSKSGGGSIIAGSKLGEGDENNYRDAGIGGNSIYEQLGNSFSNNPRTEYDNQCGDIYIYGGYIDAEAYNGAAAIGGAYMANAGTIHIKTKGRVSAMSILDLSVGGKLYALRDGGAGIGGGGGIHDDSPAVNVNTNIIIDEGIVEASGEGGASGIGLGYKGRAGEVNITINGGTVYGDSGYAPFGYLYGAGIGYGAGSACQGKMTIKLNGGTVTATSNNKNDTLSSAQFIGRGQNTEDATVTMSDTMRVLTDSGDVAKDNRKSTLATRSCKYEWLKVQDCEHKKTNSRSDKYGHEVSCDWCSQTWSGDHKWGYETTKEQHRRICLICGYPQDAEWVKHDFELAGQICVCGMQGVIITFNTGEGPAVLPAYVRKGSDYSLPSTEMQGFKLIGWKKNGDSDDKIYKPGETIEADSNMKFTAVWSRDWKELQKLMKNGGNITLDDDYISGADDTSLVVPANKSVVLDLNGHTIDRNLYNGDAVEGGSVIIAYGKLTINDSSKDKSGVITGGKTQEGAGGIIIKGGKVNLNGGTIKENASNPQDYNASSAGGILITNDGDTVGSLNMSGGSITGNSARHAGGVEVRNGVFRFDDGSISKNTGMLAGGVNVTAADKLPFAEGGNPSVIMNGGEISKNTALYCIYKLSAIKNMYGSGGVALNDDLAVFEMSGGAISENILMGFGKESEEDKRLGGGVNVAAGTLKVSGSPLIAGNHSLSPEGPESNVYLPAGKTITIKAALTNNASIGVTAGREPTATDPVNISSGLEGRGNKSVFSSDDTSYGVSLNGTEAALVKQNTITFKPGEGSGKDHVKVIGSGESIEMEEMIPEAFGITAPAGKEFAGWEYEGIIVQGNLVIMRDFTFTATWSDKVYSVSVTADEHGTARASASKGTHGSKVNLYATPADGYLFDKWTVVKGRAESIDDTNSANTALTIGTSDVTVKAIFKEIPPVHPTKIRFATGSKTGTLKEGAATVLRISFVPSDATNQTVIWSSEDDSIASVDNNGKITANREGVTHIYALPEDNANDLKPIAYKLTVTHEHKLTHIYAKAANCAEEEDGNIEYWVCDDEKYGCGKFFGDEDHTTELKPDDVFIPAEHTWGKWEKTKDPTDTEDGEETRECSKCDARETRPIARVPRVPVTGVTLDKDSIQIAEGDSEKLIATVKPADASVDTVTWSSSDAGIASVSADGLITAAGQGQAKITARSNDSTVDMSASCTVTVTHVHKLSHVSRKEASCTETGNIEYWVCDQGGFPCHKYYSDGSASTEIQKSDTIIPITGHEKSTTPEISKIIKPTCVDPGSHVEVYKCLRCDAVMEEKTVVDPVAVEGGHDWGDWTVIKEVTDTEEGIQKHICNRCGETETVRIPINGHEHSLTFVPQQDPTCIEHGISEHYECSDCDTWFYDENGNEPVVLHDQLYISAKGHKQPYQAASTGITAATCEESGGYTVTEKCSVCGAVLRIEHITDEPTGHDWGDWQVKTPATANSKGEEIRVCKNDPSHTETRVIPSIPDTSGDAVTGSSAFAAKAVAKGKSAVKLSWTGSNGADRYVVYMSKSGKSFKKIKTLGTSKRSFIKKKLAKNKKYRFRIVAQKKVNGKYTKLATSKTMTVVTANKAGKYTNAKKLSVKPETIDLKAGSSGTIKASITKAVKGKKLLSSKRRYFSTNNNIARVNSKGRITAVGTGECMVYALAHNGVWDVVKVNVK